MIRKTLTSACAALALAAGVATPAFADATHDINTQDVFFNFLDFGDGLDMYGEFGNTFAAKGTYDEVFRFFSPPVPSQISFDAAIDRIGGSASFKFTGFDFGVVNYENWDAQGNFLGVNVTSLDMGDSSFNKFSLSGESADFVGSGWYYVEIKGVSLLPNGGFGGHINTAAIPEPTNVALLLAGLGLLGTMARRRKSA